MEVFHSASKQLSVRLYSYVHMNNKENAVEQVELNTETVENVTLVGSDNRYMYTRFEKFMKQQQLNLNPRRLNKWINSYNNAQWN